MTTIIKNADIYTSDEKNPKANCIVFSGKKIDFVGDEADLDMEKYADADIHDIGGKCLRCAEAAAAFADRIWISAFRCA